MSTHSYLYVGDVDVTEHEKLTAGPEVSAGARLSDDCSSTPPSDDRSFNEPESLGWLHWIGRKLSDLIKFLFTPIRAIVNLIELYNAYTENPHILDTRTKKVLTQIIAALFETFATYGFPVLFIWILAGTPIVDPPEASWLHDIDTWWIINYVTAVGFFLSAFIARLLRIRWDVEPIILVAKKQESECQTIRDAHILINEHKQNIEALTSRASEQNKASIVAQYLAQHWESIRTALCNISRTIDNFDPRGVGNPYSIRSRIHYSSAIAFIHKIIRLFSLFCIGMSFYFLYLFCADRMSKEPEWDVTRRDWALSIAFATAAAFSAPDSLSRMETNVQRQYVQTMLQKLLEMNTLFQEALFPLAALLLSHSELAPEILSIENKDIRLANVKEHMQSVLSSRLGTGQRPESALSKRHTSVNIDLITTYLETAHRKNLPHEEIMEGLKSLPPAYLQDHTHSLKTLQEKTHWLLNFMRKRNENLTAHGIEDVFNSATVMKNWGQYQTNPIPVQRDRDMTNASSDEDVTLSV